MQIFMQSVLLTKCQAHKETVPQTGYFNALYSDFVRCLPSGLKYTEARIEYAYTAHTIWKEMEKEKKSIFTYVHQFSVRFKEFPCPYRVASVSLSLSPALPLARTWYSIHTSSVHYNAIAHLFISGFFFGQRRCWLNTCMSAFYWLALVCFSVCLCMHAVIDD